MALRKPRYSAAVVAACLLALLAPATAGAGGAKPAAGRLHVAVTPVTAKVGTAVTVTGTVRPKGGTVTLQRLVGKKWVALTHAKPSRTGTFALAFHAPKAAATLALRVVPARVRHGQAVVSATLHVHVVKTAYAVSAAPASASLTTPAPLTITGKVTPKGTGSVVVQRLVKTTWVTLGKAPLTKTSTFTYTKALAAGSYRLRVSKPFSTKVAGGVSKGFTVTVTNASTPPPPPVNNPVVATTALPALTAGRTVSTALVASGGTAPYAWAVVAGTLPAGLVLVPSGVVSGAPTTIGTTSFTVRVSDAAGRSATGVVTATVGPVVVRAWGYNLNGETGNGTTTIADTVNTAALPANVKTISVGLHYGLALLTDGRVFAWGQNNEEQLGLGDLTDRATPVAVPGLSNVVSIAAGLESSYAVTAAGQLYAWGANESGELADGTTTGPVKAPQLVSLVANVVAVAAGDQFALALFASGRIDAWGNGIEGTLGDGTETLQQKTPKTIPTLSGVRAIVAGQVDAYALLDDGTVQGWGRDDHGEPGNTAPPRDSNTWQPVPVPVTG